MFPSVFDILKIGIGPSSSHTLGPLRAAQDFRRALMARGEQGGRITATLLGSLALTGKGHMTDLAVTAGLSGADPTVNSRPTLPTIAQEVRNAGRITVGSTRFTFQPDRDLVLDTQTPPPHPNTVIFRLLEENGTVALEETYQSIGGGRVLGGMIPPPPTAGKGTEPISMNRLLEECLGSSQDMGTWVRDNEWRSHGLDDEEVTRRLSMVWETMVASIETGLMARGLLPGRLQLDRRAAEMYERLQKSLRSWQVLSHEITLASIYAIAVAEENATGGRVATAPTCGSAGIVPATLRVIQERFFLPDAKIHQALLVAGAVGTVAAVNASIAGAEVGCQGEVGVASAMAAAAACHLLGGTVLQVEFAAETALEHHLGLTCDPVDGLVQIPCIERNAVGAVTALNAANMALLSSGKHLVSYDTAISTMKEIGHDMHCKYKETALGGLAAQKR